MALEQSYNITTNHSQYTTISTALNYYRFSKQLGILTLTVEHNCIVFMLQEFTTTTCFGPICGPSSGCG